jgi:hypothetical protein
MTFFWEGEKLMIMGQCWKGTESINMKIISCTKETKETYLKLCCSHIEQMFLNLPRCLNLSMLN